MERALVARAVAEERHDNVVLLLHFQSQRGAGGQRNAAARDAVRAKEALVHRAHVLRTAAAAAITGQLAKQFGHDFVNIQITGQQVAVATMVGDDPIRVANALHDADGGCLLPDAEMGGAAQQPLAEQAAQRLLERTYLHHQMVEFQ